MKNIWIPHIPKNGGWSLIYTLRAFCSYAVYSSSKNLKDFGPFEIYEKYNRDYVEIKNIKNNNYIRLDHDNPLPKNKNEWIKILITRDPISRYISQYNFEKWWQFRHENKIFNLTIDEYIETGECVVPHIDHLNNVQEDFSDYEQSRIFNIKTISSLFDYIIDIDYLKKVFKLIEDNFLQSEIIWFLKNSADERIKELNIKQQDFKFNVFKKEQLTQEQLHKIYKIPNIIKDLEFYNSIKK